MPEPKPTQPAPTQPLDLELELDPVVDEDRDTQAETRPLPDAEPHDRGALNPELLPTLGHIGRYALKHVIGEGGLGTVYAAHDPLLSRLIAIKTLHVDLPQADREPFNALFLNEAKAAGSLNHPHIVTVYDAGTSEKGTYIAMEWLRGKDLRQLLTMGWKPTPAQAVVIVRRVANALAYAHHQGVIHRDIKPANIFMVGRTQPRVLDFGIARIRQAESLAQRDDPQSRFQEIMGGSPYYMAPEQVRREPVDRRVDVYALGVVLYELLTFQRAFNGNSLEDIADAVLNRPVPLAHELNPSVPPALSLIVAQAMHRDLAQRTRSARLLAEQLREWLDGAQGEAGAQGLTQQSLARRGVWRKRVVGAGVAGAVLAAVASMVLMQGTGRPPLAASLPSSQASMVREPASAVALPASRVASSMPLLASAPLVSSQGPQGLAASALVDPGAAAASKALVRVAKGQIKLAISPWGEVSVDGKPMGLAPPLTQLTLPVGAHRIVVRNGADVLRQTVVVKASEPVKLSHQF